MSERAAKVMLVALLLLLIAVFLVAVVRRDGATARGLPGSADRERWLGGLGEWTSAPGLSDLDPSHCHPKRTREATTFRLPEQAGCDIRVLPGGWLPRAIIVRSKSRVSVSYDSEGEPDVPTRLRLPTDEQPRTDARLSLTTEAGQLRVECEQAGAGNKLCEVELRNP